MAFDAPIHANQQSLERVLNAGLPVMLVFWQRNCAPCDQLAPTLDRLAHEYAGRALVVKVDAAAETGLVHRYEVTHLPHIFFFKDGRLSGNVIGAAGKDALAAWLNYLSRGGAQPPIPTGPSVPIQATERVAYGTRAAEPRRQEQPAADGRPVVLTETTFDRAIRGTNKPVLVDFWAEWCGPCKMIAPAVAQLAQEFAGRAVVAKLNVDENPAIARRYNIMSIPALLIFRDGQVVDQVVGVQPIYVLRQRLAAFAR